MAVCCQKYFKFNMIMKISALRSLFYKKDFYYYTNLFDNICISILLYTVM